MHYESDVVAHKGGLYQAQRDTAREPGQHVDWLCLALPGADGKDGIDGRSFNISGTYDPNAEYSALDVVTLNSTWFVAKHDKPGPCPGDGWKAGPCGRRGDKGERGERGPAGPSVLCGEIDRRDYILKLLLSDGSEVPISCRGFFEQYHEESR